MQFVAIRWGVTAVTAKKMATGMATDSTATIMIHVGIVLAANTQYAKLILLPMIKQLAHACLLSQETARLAVSVGMALKCMEL
jgi:undecaprenyl pyrophosphate synthase